MDETEQKLAEQFAANLRGQRQARGWTQAVFAERAGVTTHYVALLETARKLPTLRTLNELARALGTEPGALLVQANTSGDPWLAEIGQIASAIAEPNRLWVRDVLKVAAQQPRARDDGAKRRAKSKAPKRVKSKPKRK